MRLETIYPDSARRDAERDKTVRLNSVDPATEALMVDLLAWLAPRPRPYAEVMAAWRTSCPRLPVWEEVNDRRLVSRQAGMIAVTDAGRSVLAANGSGRKWTLIPAESPD